MKIKLATVRGIARQAGAGRISDEACRELALVAEQFVEEIARTANQLASHSKRKTILLEDVKLAVGLKGKTA